MYGLTRGATTLVGVIVAGVLIWLGVDALSGESIGRGEFWWAVTMCALAGLVMALSQVLGGWTKWGWPRLSLNVFLFAFLPALIAGDGSFCTPSGRRAPGRRRARLVERSRNRRSRRRSGGLRHAHDRIRPRACVRPHIRHHRPSGPPESRACRRGRTGEAPPAGRNDRRVRIHEGGAASRSGDPDG